MHFIDYDPEGRIRGTGRDESLGGRDTGRQGVKRSKTKSVIAATLVANTANTILWLMNYEFDIPHRDKAILPLALFFRRLNFREIHMEGVRTRIRCTEHQKHYVI